MDEGGSEGTGLPFLPYHDIGKGKHERMGTMYNPENLPLSTPSPEVMQRCIRQLEAAGLNVRTGG